VASDDGTTDLGLIAGGRHNDDPVSASVIEHRSEVMLILGTGARKRDAQI
jgi:hypothetical protein